MTGSAITIEDASAADTIVSVKHRVFAVNRKMPVHRQRLVYRPGPRGMEPLADDDTLGGAGVAQDGSAELDVLLAELAAADAARYAEKVWLPPSNSPTLKKCVSIFKSPLPYQSCHLLYYASI